MSSLHRDELIRALPYARRYARALTGSQPGGDALVAASLQAMLAAPQEDLPARDLLYLHVTDRFTSRNADAATITPGMTAAQRQLLLLTALEELPLSRAAMISRLDEEAAATMLADARAKLRAAAATDVLIIEDEPIIAMDIEELVQSCGHRVVGVASTEAEAVAIAKRTTPGLILADINLGIGGDGSNAVARIVALHATPVIFVTAYPERLLTGDTAEPTYVITKPFEPLTLAIATYQAVTGGVQSVAGVG